jgi:hypothetical protein
MLYLFEQQYSMPGRKRLGYLFTAWRYSAHPKVCPRNLVMNNKPLAYPRHMHDD